jgi:hypothetical protein
VDKSALRRLCHHRAYISSLRQHAKTFAPALPSLLRIDGKSVKSFHFSIFLPVRTA